MIFVQNVLHLFHKIIYIMSVTYKIMVMPHQVRSDGSNFIRIRITHDRQKRYFKTAILLEKKEYTPSGKIKNDEKLRMAEDVVRRMKDVTNAIDSFDLAGMDCEEVIKRIETGLTKPKKFTLDFYEYGLTVAGRKSKGTAQIYTVALNAMLRFFKNEHPDISQITVRNLRKFEEYLSNEKVVKVDWRTGKSKSINKTKGKRAPSLYIGAIRHVYKCARLEFNEPDQGIINIPVDPFEYYSVPKIPASRHRDIPLEWVQLMIDQRESLTERIRMAVDAFLISFGLMGMNAVDMFTCEKPKKDILHYYRTKTTERRDDEAEMFVRIEPCIKKIIKEYKDSSRCFDYHKKYSNKDTFTTALNQGLKIWIKRNNLEHFTFYSARHTWATVARSKKGGMEKSLITAGLCHVDYSTNKMDDVYARLDWETVWDANAKVLGLLDWK